MKTLVIGDEDTVIGFSLAGVPGFVAQSQDEVRRAFEQATQTEDVGILLITERTARMIRQSVDDWIVQGGHPLIVEIPDGQGPLEDRRTPHEFVKSAIGVNF